MPELPEVEVTRRGLLPVLPGRMVTEFIWNKKPLRRPVPVKFLDEHIVGHRLLTIDRRAKFLLFRMENSAILLLHLGMSGKLGLFPAGAALAKHDHFRLGFDNDIELRLNDTRRFGAVDVWPPARAAQLEREFAANSGLEPLAGEFTIKALQKAARGRSISIKSFLMDAKQVAGIGNIYANEILFATGVNPATPANTVSPAQWREIVKHSRAILGRAIEAGGTTISDFLGSNGRPGYFKAQLQVYGRAGEPCKKCNEIIKKKVQNGRATYFCPKCQGD